MAIARRPKTNESRPNVDVDALINKGGSIAHTGEIVSEASLPPEKQVALRIPFQMIADIDISLKRRTVRIPRHTWILEAIAEKLERETTAPDL